jgi:signal transduction histidine kinase
MENACKWARRHVAVTITAGGGRLRLVVEDDGPGLPDAIHAGTLQRGRRLDEAVPGSGLGLAVIGELVELYGGRIDFGTASSGGARVELDLPQGRCDQSSVVRCRDGVEQVQLVSGVADLPHNEKGRFRVTLVT